MRAAVLVNWKQVMPKFSWCILAVIIALGGLAARATRADDQKVIVQVAAPSEQPVAISKDTLSLADAIKAISANSGMQFRHGACRRNYWALKITFAHGGSSLWKRLEETCVAANLSVEMSGHGAVISRAVGDIVGHSIVGPTIMIVRIFQSPRAQMSTSN